MQPFNKYYPPDWTPEKGSVNKFVGKHPLGDRARKIDQGILIVRFELPFNIWCEGCGNHVGKGVRYNAEKKKIGKYFSTPIFSFRMKCHLCDNWIEIHTDPKNAEYLVVSGARKKIETWEPEDSEVIKLKDDDEAKKMVDDALYKLEYSVKDELRSKEALPILTQLQRLNDKQWADPYTHSQRMRKIFREEKKELEAKKRVDEEICDRNALSIPLLPESEEDIVKARTTEFSDHLLEKAQKRKLEITASSIFNKQTSKSKKSKFRTHDSKDNFAKLSAIVAVNTKLKTDPFLKDNDWNTGNNTEKGGENNKDLVIIKKKENNHQQSEVLDSGNIISVNDKNHKGTTTGISLVSADYDDDDDDEISK
ncbi:hypothetical protein RclHR1_03630014 [Rhizophagus clarus]|uniref:Coiled-coil domain-containing protein 130 homolog n=1 Tax=Rhizophagus clarus TaxID=94130 RepID=A0A2Z6S6D8_9GLOM|nr:hypothetical protein RclHR1_03630014 [Rhizophagus clarus]GES81434.1 coiled-coil domain-containing protein 130 homolog [Rhizophagus clarus]